MPKYFLCTSRKMHKLVPFWTPWPKKIILRALYEIRMCTSYVFWVVCRFFATRRHSSSSLFSFCSMSGKTSLLRALYEIRMCTSNVFWVVWCFLATRRHSLRRRCFHFARCPVRHRHCVLFTKYACVLFTFSGVFLRLVTTLFVVAVFILLDVR